MANVELNYFNGSKYIVLYPSINDISLYNLNNLTYHNFNKVNLTGNFPVYLNFPSYKITNYIKSIIIFYDIYISNFSVSLYGIQILSYTNILYHFAPANTQSGKNVLTGVSGYLRIIDELVNNNRLNIELASEGMYYSVGYNTTTNNKSILTQSSYTNSGLKVFMIYTY